MVRSGATEDRTGASAEFDERRADRVGGGGRRDGLRRRDQHSRVARRRRTGVGVDGTVSRDSTDRTVGLRRTIGVDRTVEIRRAVGFDGTVEIRRTGQSAADRRAGGRTDWRTDGEGVGGRRGPDDDDDRRRGRRHGERRAGDQDADRPGRRAAGRRTRRRTVESDVYVWRAVKGVARRADVPQASGWYR